MTACWTASFSYRRLPQPAERHGSHGVNACGENRLRHQSFGGGPSRPVEEGSRLDSDPIVLQTFIARLERAHEDKFKVSTMKLLARLSVFSSLVLGSLVAGSPATLAADAPSGATAAISYYKQIRPIFQANCQGCHQPAKASGKYVMTDFAKLLAGGESGDAAIVPGKLDESHLVAMITPVDGKADMPKDRPALPLASVELIKAWIASGAPDDSAAYAAPQIRPGASAGLCPAGGDRLARLFARRQVAGGDRFQRSAAGRRRIDARWSADWSANRSGSSRSAFRPTGSAWPYPRACRPRCGEVQVWDVATRKQVLSVPVGFNVVYGVNWSPDGKLISFGCGDGEDNSVRAIDAGTGEQVLFQGTHSDWVRETTFSVDGKNLVSVSRDMTVKLTEVATQRFIDNVTSITPGALKGGIANRRPASQARPDHCRQLRRHAQDLIAFSARRPGLSATTPT